MSLVTIAAGTTGRDGFHRDPVWRTTLALHPAERHLLTLPVVRRLHHVAFAGAARVVTPLTFSRLEHGLGSLGLAGHFFAADAELRVAALVHDLGQLPLSGTLEGLAGLDTHKIGLARFDELAGELAAWGVDAGRVRAHLSGEEPSVLRGGPGGLGLARLDGLVRVGRANGWLETEPAALLKALRVTGSSIDTDAATASELVSLVCAEAEAAASWEHVVPAAVVRQLAGPLLANHGTDMVSRWTDDELWVALIARRDTSPEAVRLRSSPQLWHAWPVEAGDPGVTYTVPVPQRVGPLVDGKPVAERLPGLSARLSALDGLPRHFRVRRVSDR